MHDPPGQHHLHAQLCTHFLDLRGLPFIAEGDTVRDDLEPRQPGQAVVDAFRDSIGNVFGIGVGALDIQRENGDGIDLTLAARRSEEEE